MPLGSRRRVLAAVATAGVAIVLAVVASGRGCAPEDTSPDGAVKLFVAAARAGDRRAAFALLGPETRERLERAAADATAKVGGTRRFAPLELFDVRAGAGTWVPSGYKVLARTADTATVEVRGEGGARDVVRVVRVAGRWRIELDLE